MGCIPSKSAVPLDFEVINPIPTHAEKVSHKESKSRNIFRSCKGRSPPSPVVEGERPPWLESRAVLTEKDGVLLVVEPS